MVRSDHVPGVVLPTRSRFPIRSLTGFRVRDRRVARQHGSEHGSRCGGSGGTRRHTGLGGGQPFSTGRMFGQMRLTGGSGLKLHHEGLRGGNRHHRHRDCPGRRDTKNPFLRGEGSTCVSDCSSRGRTPDRRTGTAPFRRRSRPRGRPCGRPSGGRRDRRRVPRTRACSVGRGTVDASPARR